MIKKILCLFAFTSIVLSSCVPARKVDECNDNRTACENELSALKTTNQSNEAKLKELGEQLTQMTKDIQHLNHDTTVMGSSLRMFEAKYDKLNTLNEELLDKYNKLLSGSEKDNAKLSGDLQMTQAQLLKKQDELNALSAQLAQQKKDLDALSDQLKQ